MNAVADQTSLLLTRTAELSEDGVYRYRLGRRWSDCLPDGDQVATFVMCNPSTADAYADDPTIRRCMAFARRDGLDAIDVVNLYAYRATKPIRVTEALCGGIDVVGPYNLMHLDEAIRGATIVVAAWGASIKGVPTWRDRVEQVRELADAAGRELLALGHTAGGHPRHPLYVRGDAPLVDAGFAEVLR